MTFGGQNSEIQDSKHKLFNKNEMSVKHLEYAFKFLSEDGPYELLGIKNIKDDPGSDMLNDLATLYVNAEGDDA